ncbi:MAG: hypothetical protein AAFR03_06675 [Pseudomonadota bacterium]
METWHTLGAVKGKAATEASLQAHYAAQWLGRFGRGLTPPKEDDSHTSFVWRTEVQSLVTDPVEQAGKSIQLALRVSTLSLLIIVDDEIADGMSLHGRGDKTVGAWLRPALEGFGFSLDQFNEDPIYEMPASPLASGGVYDANGCIAALSELARAYDNAQPLLDDLRSQYVGKVSPGPSPVRTWPHHFDTGLIITLEEDAPFEDARAVGAGIAVPDKLFDEFYFYTYPWPRHPRKNLPKLKSHGAYQKTGFFGAVLPVSIVAKQRDQSSCVKAFLEETTAAWKDMVEKEIAEGK